ncbi:alpha-1,3-mannosyltransferase [Purpureocillium lavendulum]|uniref:Alpha-1,3-mannosyltransferase n=1 Tax=Purpureocillium lavendulum TaxID=1247861 RepID=A0AB34FH71_9HYPO|nr:alpha-1,3-mannosyltransferase [Purpureocillium lavendulum]
MRDIQYFLASSSIDPSQGDRIRKLADLRNLALEPLLQRRDQLKPSGEAAVVFLNDVALCPDDILELVLQRGRLDATMTCAMDWTYVGRDPTFYDVWIARSIHGDSFFDIPADGSWNSAWNLLWNADEDIRSRLHSKRPFPVFSCWNGAAVFSAGVVLEHGVRFRSSNTEKGECVQGEPQLFCKDLWFRGLGKVAVVPAVNLEYSVERGKQIKESKGFTVANVAGSRENEDDKIKWRPPPDMVKCMPTWDNQFWQLWNETLA